MQSRNERFVMGRLVFVLYLSESQNQKWVASTKWILSIMLSWRLRKKWFRWFVCFHIPEQTPTSFRNDFFPFQVPFLPLSSSLLLLSQCIDAISALCWLQLNLNVQSPSSLCWTNPFPQHVLCGSHVILPHLYAQWLPNRLPRGLTGSTSEHCGPQHFFCSISTM